MGKKAEPVTLSGRALPRRERVRLIAAALFGAASYALFTTFKSLQTLVPLDPLSPRRALAAAVGAILFWAFTRFVERNLGQPRRQRVRLIAGGIFGAMLVMLASGALFDFLLAPFSREPVESLARAARINIVWTGYFLAASTAFLALTPSAGGAAAPARAAEADRAPAAAPPADPAAPPDAPRPPEHLWVTRNRETVRVDLAAIEWLEAEGDYVRVHATGGGGLMRATLAGLERTLDPEAFVRVHRSALCRRRAIVALQRKSSGALAARLESGAEIPVGRRYRAAIGELVAGPRAMSG